MTRRTSAASRATLSELSVIKESLVTPHRGGGASSRTRLFGQCRGRVGRAGRAGDRTRALSRGLRFHHVVLPPSTAVAAVALQPLLHDSRQEPRRGAGAARMDGQSLWPANNDA